MKIKHVEGKNFMRSEHFSLDFKEGINVLSGSIGSGKSSVLEVMSFCLLDKTRGSSWKDYIKRGTKGFEIKLIIEAEPGEDMVFHYVGKSSSSTCEKTITYKEQTYVNSDCKILLSSTFDIDMIERVVFTMQNVPPLSAMTPAVRREIFKKIFNSDFSAITDVIKKDQTSLNEEITLLKAKIDSLLQKEYPMLEITPVDESALLTLKSELSSIQEFELLTNKYSFYLEKVKDRDINKTKVESLQKSLVEKDNKIKELTDSLQASLSKIEEEKESLNSIKSSIESLEDDKNTTANLITSFKSELEELSDSIDAKRYSVKIERLTDKIVSLKTDVSMLSKHIDTHLKGTCSECGQVCPPKGVVSLEEEKKAKEEEMKVIQDDISKLKSQEKEDLDILKSKNKELSDMEVSLKNKEMLIEHRKASLSLKQRDIDYHSTTYDRIREKDIPSVESEKKDIQGSILEAEKVYTESVKWCEDNIIEKPVSTCRKKEDVEKEIQDIVNTKASNLEKDRINKETEETQKKDKVTIEELNLTVSSLHKSLKELDEVKAIFDVEFPAYVNLRACSLLQDYMNSFFSQVTPNFKVKIDLDKKGVNVFYTSDDSGIWGELKMASGGEGALATLGFNVATAHAFGSELLVLDEPDHASDPDSGTRLFETINSISGFNQLIVISHKPSALEFFKENGANVYYVDQGNFSQVFE